MPFESQAQRGLFHAARTNPEVRKRFGLKLKDVKAMIEDDKPGKLPKYKPGMDGILIAISKRPRGSMLHKGEVNAMRRDIGKALIDAIKSGDPDHVMECLDLAANLRDELRDEAKDEVKEEVKEDEGGEESGAY